MTTTIALGLSLLLTLPQDVAAPDDLTTVVDETVVASTQTDAFVGLSVAVAKDDAIVFARGYGLAEAEHGVAVDENTTFRMGSITKQFTAAAICRLAEEYELDLDVDMNEYVPDFPTQGRTVTLRHLLTHTSGIPSYTSLGPGWRRTVPLELTHEELLDLVAGSPFQFEPGTAFLYNNTGYYLLGVVIENVTEVGYGDYLARELFGPLGLTRTLYDSNTRLVPNRAQGYQLLDGELSNDGLIGMSQPGAAGALSASARDLVAWDIALRNGKVVQPETYAEMTVSYLLENAEETGYGFGLFLGDRNGARSVWHGGGINGFNSMLAHYPDAGWTIAVISNCEGFDASAVESDIALALLAAAD